MKNKVLRVAAIIALSVCVCFSFCACGNSAKNQFPTATEKFFVNDFAAILNETDADAIYKKGVALQEATTAQVVVVTVESLDGKAIEDYALEIGRKWGVGDKEKNNGIVVLLSESDREIYIAVGYGLEGALPDSKTGRIIDTYGIPYFSNDNFSVGLASVYDVIVNEIYIEYGIAPAENYVPIDRLPDVNADSTTAGQVILSWIALIVCVALYMAIFGRRGGLFIFGPPRFFGSNHYHGGFSGSSGSFGGFGGFKGGGGSFGGGGAGRGF